MSVLQTQDFRITGHGRAGHSENTEGEYLEETSTGATLTLTKSHLSITMPVDMKDDDNYFQAERLLLCLVQEALELLDGWRDAEELADDKAYRDRCNQRFAGELPTMDRSVVLALRDLAQRDSLPIGQGALLEILDTSLLAESDVAD